MKKIGDFVLSEAEISVSKTSRIVKAINSKGKIVAVKEIRTTDFTRRELAREQEIVRELLTNQNRFIVPFIEFHDEKNVVYFVEELVKGTLAKELTAYQVHTMGEKLGLLIFTHVLSGYKFFYKKGLVFQHLNLGSVLRHDGETRLTIPTSIINNAQRTLRPTNVLDPDYLYLAPEQLVNPDGKLTAKVDIWSLGVLLYRLMFGFEPWHDFEFPKKYFIAKDPERTLKYLHFGYLSFVNAVGLRFPRGHCIHSSVIDLLQKMLVIRPDDRMSMEQVVQHPFLEYFAALARSNSPGGQMNLLKQGLDPIQFKLPDLDRLIAKTEKNILQTEIKDNFKLRNEKLQRIRDHPKAPEEPTSGLGDVSSISAQAEVDEYANTTLQQLESELNLSAAKMKPTIKVSMLPALQNPQVDNDAVLKELEDALLNEKDEGELQSDMNLEQLKEFIVTVKKRIQLKLIAFDNIKEVLASAYIVAFRFFLLKASLFDFIQLEKALIYRDNPFNSVNWPEFKKKPVYAKITNAVYKKQAMIIDLMEDYLPKAAGVVKTTTGAQSLVSRAVNSDMTDDPTEITKVLLENLLVGSLMKRVKAATDPREKLVLAKFCVLIKLILMIEQFGKFAPMDRELEFVGVWEAVEGMTQLEPVLARLDQLAG